MEIYFWLIWLALSGFVFVIYGWSLFVLFQQKKAWKLFAEKNKMQYDGGKMTLPPSMTGYFSGYRVYMYTDTVQTQDMRGQRYVCVIEVELGQGMFVSTAIATKEMAPFILSLDALRQEVKPQSRNWDDSYIIRTRNASLIKRYLTEDRLKSLHSLFGMKSSSAIFFFDDIEAVFRIQTSDPMRDADKIKRILTRITKQLEILKPSPQEIRAITSEVKKLEELEKGTDGSDGNLDDQASAESETGEDTEMSQDEAGKA